MNAIYLGIVVFVLVLAVFDIAVGVSNDAVNFLNSAIGSKAAKFRTIILVAAVGVFAGASLSNGMMDIARHGIFTPQYYSFEEVMCIFLAVMVTDVILLDIFNTKGMPTSTTVSMVFELLGGAFALALFKVISDKSLNLGMLLNTEKALQVILAIFLSVAVAFVFGLLVQWITRIIFTFTYSRGTWLRQGVFAGISLTSIVYFLLINGLKGSTLMTPELKSFVDSNTWLIVFYCLAGFSILMAVLSFLRVNVLRIVVLSGTFALAMAFAGNDLVNFVGVPLAGLSSYQDFAANGAGDVSGYMMSSLAESARTPLFFLMTAGAIMVIALMTSKKAQNVVKTSVDLARQDEGEEMFGSSIMARSLVHNTLQTSKILSGLMPRFVNRWIDNRFNVQDAALKDGAAFDLVRASVNLVLAGLLVALGTSLKLPLSTTYVTFMVAMGSSLADRAWTRESAVFRITGVLNVIGGWFITAGVAFSLCFLVCTAMNFGGIPVMVLAIVLVIYILIRSNIEYARKSGGKDALDMIFDEIASSRNDYEGMRKLVSEHSRLSNIELLDYVRNEFPAMTTAFFDEDYRMMRKCESRLDDARKRWKRLRKREIIGMRRIDPKLAIEKNTWFFLASNSAEQMLYCMKRVQDPCIEHLANNFTPLDKKEAQPYMTMNGKIRDLFDRTVEMLQNDDFSDAAQIRSDTEKVQLELAGLHKVQIDRMTAYADGGSSMSNADILYVNILQETRELLSQLRHLIRGLVRLKG